MIIEDLTALNVKTLNNVRNHENIIKTWTWNGKIYALNRHNHKITARPFQAINECPVMLS